MFCVVIFTYLVFSPAKNEADTELDRLVVGQLDNFLCFCISCDNQAGLDQSYRHIVRANIRDYISRPDLPRLKVKVDR